MIDNLKPYAAYKDSGLPLLGEVPDHWEVATLRRYLRPYDGIKIGPFGSQLKLDQMSESGYKVYGQANVIAKDFARGTKFIGQEKYDELSSCEVRPGDLVLTMMGTSGRCARVPDDATAGVMDSHLLRLRTNSSLDRTFAAIVVDVGQYVIEQISLAGKGSIMHGLNSGMVKDLVLAVPPLDEQAAIVRFIHGADRKIRRYISAKQKLIKLLEEERPVIIFDAVTRGLQADVRRRPTQIPWLADIPDHWQEFELGRRVSLLTGFPFKSTGFSTSPTDVRLLRGINVAPGRLRWDSTVRWPVDQCDAFASYALRDGDIILGMDRPLVADGVRVAVVKPGDVPSLLLQRVARIRPLRGLLSSYLVLLLRGKAFADYLEPLFTGISVPHVSPEQIKTFRIALPNETEQEAIVAEVHDRTSRLDRAIATARQEQALLVELRTRLSAEVVTGKLDVREADARLHEEIEDVEGPGDLDGKDGVDYEDLDAPQDEAVG